MLFLGLYSGPSYLLGRVSLCHLLLYAEFLVYISSPDYSTEDLHFSTVRCLFSHVSLVLGTQRVYRTSSSSLSQMNCYSEFFYFCGCYHHFSTTQVGTLNKLDNFYHFWIHPHLSQSVNSEDSMEFVSQPSLAFLF